MIPSTPAFIKLILGNKSKILRKFIYRSIRFDFNMNKKYLL